VYQGCPTRQKPSQSRIAQIQQTYANVVSVPTEWNEHLPKTRTEDEEIQATPASQEATSHKMTETQRHTDKTSNKSDDRISQTHDLVKTLDKERSHVTPETVDGIENMEATEYQKEDKGDGRAEQGSKDPQPRDKLYETQRNDPHTTEQKPKRESEEGMEVHADAASAPPDNGHPLTDAQASPKRNKKLKPDRNREQKPERTRSLTRTAANKGKN
jgi:hypothetical protein